jgi:hypothetical protein
VTKRFVVSTDPMKAAQEKQFKDALGETAGWWHWLPNFWLIIDHGDLDVASIRDMIHKVDSSVRAIVLEVEEINWAALTRPDSEGRDMAAWIKSSWTKQ